MPVRHEANVEIYRSARIIVHGHTHKREREREREREVYTAVMRSGLVLLFFLRLLSFCTAASYSSLCLSNFFFTAYTYYVNSYTKFKMEHRSAYAVAKKEREGYAAGA
jgi:hypothetical protein